MEAQQGHTTKSVCYLVLNMAEKYRLPGNTVMYIYYLIYLLNTSILQFLYKRKALSNHYKSSQQTVSIVEDNLLLYKCFQNITF